MELKGIYSKIDILSEENKEYYEIVEDLITNEIVLSMKNYIQHGSTTTLEHCVAVSYYSYKMAKKMKIDYKACARAGLLHDLFLYDWHTNPEKMPLFKKHGFTHPMRALNNANKYFKLSEKEKDIISKHMWPLTLFQIPKYKESYVVSLADKKCSTLETFEPLFSLKKKSKIIEEK